MLEENIKNLITYVEDDESYKQYRHDRTKYLNDFDIFCINHCKDILKLIKAYRGQKEQAEFYKEKNKRLRKRIKEMKGETDV